MYGWWGGEAAVVLEYLSDCPNGHYSKHISQGNRNPLDRCVTLLDSIFQLFHSTLILARKCPNIISGGSSSGKQYKSEQKR